MKYSLEADTSPEVGSRVSLFLLNKTEVGPGAISHSTHRAQVSFLCSSAHLHTLNTFSSNSETPFLTHYMN